MRQRFSGDMCLMRSVLAVISSRPYDKWTLRVEGGRFASESPGRHSVAGRIGLGAKPPPQFGQTFCSLFSAHSAQNVHSYEQMRAVNVSAGRSLSQYSQFGRSCSAIGPSITEENNIAGQRNRSARTMSALLPKTDMCSALGDWANS